MRLISSCRLPSSSPDKSRFYEDFSADWDFRMDPHELHKRLRLVFGRLLADVRGKRVLDAGAGTGHFSRALVEREAILVSLDVGPRLLALVREKCATRAVAGSLLALPFRDGAFETVLCTEVIEHTPDPRKAVSELCRVLAPGGELALTVPNRLWKPAVRVANLIGARPYEGHENWVGYQELAAWLAEDGMALELQAGFNIIPHTAFCRPAFDVLDRLSTLHPYMINIAVLARKLVE